MQIGIDSKSLNGSTKIRKRTFSKAFYKWFKYESLVYDKFDSSRVINNYSTVFIATNGLNTNEMVEIVTDYGVGFVC